jgi:hypothetical protein
MTYSVALVRDAGRWHGMARHRHRHGIGLWWLVVWYVMMGMSTRNFAGLGCEFGGPNAGAILMWVVHTYSPDCGGSMFGVCVCAAEVFADESFPEVIVFVGGGISGGWLSCMRRWRRCAAYQCENVESIMLRSGAVELTTSSRRKVRVNQTFRNEVTGCTGVVCSATFVCS